MIAARPQLTAAAAMLALLCTAPALSATPKKATPHHKAPAHAAASPHKGDVTRAQLIAQTKKTFAMADTNHDGFISRTEFAKRMAVIVNHSGVPSKADAQRMLDAANRAFDDVDTNHDGKLSLSEAMKRPLAAFDMMDANHDGVLTEQEKIAAHQNAPQLPAGPTPDGAPMGR